MHGNAQKFDWKTQNKIVSDYTMAKFFCLDDAFSEFFELEVSPVEGQSQQQKDKNYEKNERCKKKLKDEDVGHFLIQNFDFCACPSKKSRKT